MIAVYNQTFLNDILRQDNSVEIFEYSIISDFKSTTTSDTLLKLIQSIVEEEKEGRIELVHKPLECIWEKDTRTLNLFIEFKEDLEKTINCGGIFVYYQLLGNPYTKNIAFTLLDSPEIEITTTESKIKNTIHLCQTRNLFKIVFPEIVNAELYCYVSNSDIKFLEGPGIEFGDNLYTIDEGSENQLVSKDSYIKYIREHNSATSNKTAVRWLDKNGMFGRSNSRFRNYTSINYQIGNLEAVYYSIPTLSNLNSNGGEIQIFGYADYIDYEIDSTGEINQIGEGTESISSIPSVKIILKKAEDGFTSTINNLTQTITYYGVIDLNNTLSPSGIFELVLKYYNPIDKEIVELRSDEFRLLQSETEGGWYISEFNTGFFEGNIPVYLIGDKKNDTASFEITTTLAENNLDNRKIVICPIEGDKKVFEDKFEINSTVISTSKIKKIKVDIKAKSSNPETDIWAPYITKTKDTEIDYIEIPEKTWDTYRTDNVMVGLDMSAENIGLSLSKSIEGLEKYIDSLINQEKEDNWEKFVEDYYPRSINYSELDWNIYQTGDSFFAINTEITQKLILRENSEASLQNLNEILEKIKLGRTNFSLYPGTEKSELVEEKRLEKVTKGYGIFGWNNNLNNLYVNTKSYDELIIKFKSPLSEDLELWIGNEYFGPDFTGEKYIIGKGKSEVHIDITTNSNLFEKINTIYFKTSNCNVHSENNKSINVQISNMYFHCPGNQYGIGEKKIYMDLTKIESIYNIKYSKLEYKNNTFSYIFDITGHTTGLLELSEDATEIGKQSLLYPIEISCNEYKTKFYVVQTCSSKSLKAVVFDEIWKNLETYDGTVNNSYVFETSTENYVEQDFILVNNDEEDFDDSSEEDENSWVCIKNPNSNITLSKSSGYLGHNPYINSKDSEKGITITIQTDEEGIFYGIKKYQPIVFCRTKNGETIEDDYDWRTLISRGLCFLNLSRKGTTQEISIVDNVRTLKVYEISHYTIRINANCPFCVDVSDIKTRDYNIFGESIDGVNCFEVEDKNGIQSNDKGVYYSSFEEYETTKSITLYLVRLKFNFDQGDWGNIRIYPQEKEDTFSDILINVVADNITPQTINPFRETLAVLESKETIYYTPNVNYYDIFLGNKNNYVDFFCVDKYHPHGHLDIISDSYFDNEDQGLMTELTPKFTYVTDYFGYGFHTSRYTQKDYLLNEYPLQFPRFKYTLYDIVNPNPSIEFYIWGKGKPLTINGETSGNKVLYLFGNKTATREFTFSYPVNDELYRKVTHVNTFQEDHLNSFSYNFQQKADDSSKKILTISSNVTNGYTGYLGKIVLTFSLTTRGFIMGRIIELKEIEKYVSPVTLTIEVYQRRAEEEGTYLQTDRYFDRTFNGMIFPFYGADTSIYPNWISEDNDKEKTCTIYTDDNYKENSHKYTFYGTSNSLRLQIPSRISGSGYEGVPLFAQQWNNYRTYFYGDMYYSGIAAMQIKDTPADSFKYIYNDPFRVKQPGYNKCLVYKSGLEDGKTVYDKARVFFGNKSTNYIEETVSHNTTQFKCILAAIKLAGGILNPVENNVEIPSIIVSSPSITCDIIRRNLQNWDRSKTNCTITLPINTDYMKKSYTISFEIKQDDTTIDSRLTLNIIQEGVTGEVELLNTLGSIGTDLPLPYLSNGVFIGGETIGELDFKTNISLNELTIWYDDRILIDSSHVIRQIVEDAEDGYYYAKLNYTIPKNKGNTLNNCYLYFKRHVIDSSGNSEYIEIKKYKISQGYYCFKLGDRYDGQTLGSESDLNDYKILSYGQGIDTPWDSRVKFQHSLELHEVNIDTGKLEEDSKLSGLEGGFTLTESNLGLQTISYFVWYYNGITHIPSTLKNISTRIVWGEEKYEGDFTKIDKYPFLENIYEISDLSTIKTAMDNILVEVIINVRYPSNQTILFTENSTVNSAINNYLRNESLNYHYLIHLHKPAGSIPDFGTSQSGLSMSGNGEINDEITTTLAPSSLGDIDVSLINYTATSNTEWLSVELIKQDSYVNNVKITAAENNSGAERTGEITIKINSPFVAESTKKTITITQAAKD